MPLLALNLKEEASSCFPFTLECVPENWAVYGFRYFVLSLSTYGDLSWRVDCSYIKYDDFMIWIPVSSFQTIHQQQEEAQRCWRRSFSYLSKSNDAKCDSRYCCCIHVYLLGSMEEAQGTLLVGFPKSKQWLPQCIA